MKTAIESVLQRYEQWDNDLYNRYIEKFNKDTTIWDGVICPDVYAKAPIKVMFLNREAYDPDPENVPYDLCEAIRERIKKNDWVFPGQNTLRTHLKQYLAVLNMGQRGFLGLSDEDVRQCVQSTAYDDFIENLKGVAYCNVKKTDGKPRSNKGDLKNYANMGLNFLKEQILFFNPSIILAGDVCEGILDELFEWGDNLYGDPNQRLNIWQVKIGDKLFPYADMFHPSRTQGMSEYYLELLHALQEVERNHSNIWRDSMDRRCFGENDILNQDIERLNTLYDKLEELSGSRFRKGTIKSDYEIQNDVQQIANEVKAIEQKHYCVKTSKELSILMKETKERISEINDSFYDPSIIDSVMDDLDPEGEIGMDD